MGVDAGTIYSEVRVRLDKLNGDVNSVNAKLDQMSAQSKNKAGAFSKNWSNSFGVIKLAGIAAFTAITVAVKKAITIFAGFEQSIANVASVTKGTAQELTQLEDAAKTAGETTRFTATQAADALYFLASAGFSAAQSIDALDGVLQLAGATQSDLAFTSETVAATISQYNLEAKDATKISNTFAAAIANSQATMDKLATAFRQVGPVAAGLGISLEETTGTLQILFNAGFRGQQAGRALKSALADLASPTSTLTDVFTGLGISLDKVNPEFNSMDKIIDEIAKSGAKTSDIIKAFGKVAGPQLAVLIKKGGKAIRDYTKDVTNTNAAAEAYAIQNDTLAGSFDFLKSKIEGAAITFSEQLSPGLREILDTITELVEAFKPLISFAGQFINVALKLVSLPLKAFTTAVEAGLGGVSRASKEAAKDIENANEAIKEAGDLQQTADNINSLTDEYDLLNSKTNLSEKEQARLQAVIAEIERIVPNAITRFDEYGNAVEISGERSRSAARALLETRKAVILEAKTRLDLRKPLLDNIILQDKAEADRVRKETLRLSQETTIANERIVLARKFFAEYSSNQLKTTSLADAFNKTIDENSDELGQLGLNFEKVGGFSESLRNQLTELAVVQGESETVVNKFNKALAKENKIVLKVEDAEKQLEELEKLSVELENVLKGLLGLEKIDPVAREVFDAFAGMPLVFDAMATAADKAGVSTSDFFDKLKDNAKTSLEFIEDISSSLIAFSKASTDAKIEDLDRQLQAELEAKGLLEETETSRLQREVQEAKDAGNTTLADEKQRELDRVKITQKFEKQKAQIQYEAANVQWALQLAQATATGALAVIAGLATEPFVPAGIAAGAIATGLTGIQIATILQSKPQPPAFDTGGIVPGNSFTGDRVNAMVNSGEMILNQDQQQRLFGIANGNQSTPGSVINATINVLLDGVLVAENTARIMNDSIVTLDSERALR